MNLKIGKERRTKRTQITIELYILLEYRSEAKFIALESNSKF